MKRKMSSTLLGCYLTILCFTQITNALASENQLSLTVKQQSIIPIAAFTAKGDIDKLNRALNEGLDAGLTVNEAKEVIVQMYAYTGFPRSLNGLNALMAVITERKTKGITDELGKDASPLPKDKTIRELGTQIQTEIVGRPVSGSVYDFAPIIDTFLKEHLFGDIFGRDVLDFQERELATVSALASLPAENQLLSHLNVSFNVGLTTSQMRHFLSILNEKVGTEEAQIAKRLLEVVIQNRQQ